ncbi:MAG: hypothetical protein U0031_03625 [Thermomicrobiales bacterium]
MSEANTETGMGTVRMTPEAGPVDAGAPAAAPGAGQVQTTPEAAPLADIQPITPPTLHDHMRGPILGLDDIPPMAPPPAAPVPPPVEPPAPPRTPDDIQEAAASSRDERDNLSKWPPHTGKPVTDVNWKAVGRYAAPIAAQAEDLAIKGIDLSARGLSWLARYLEARRDRRD